MNGHSRQIRSDILTHFTVSVAFRTLFFENADAIFNVTCLMGYRQQLLNHLLSIGIGQSAILGENLACLIAQGPVRMFSQCRLLVQRQAGQLHRTVRHTIQERLCRLRAGQQNLPGNFLQRRRHRAGTTNDFGPQIGGSAIIQTFDHRNREIRRRLRRNLVENRGHNLLIFRTKTDKLFRRLDTGWRVKIRISNLLGQLIDDFLQMFSQSGTRPNISQPDKISSSGSGKSIQEA